MKQLKSENGDLDAVDNRILALLLKDARTPVAEIARKVGMSSPSVSERIRRLEERGTIEGYAVKLNPAAFGLPLAAWLRIRPVPGQLGTVAEIIKTIPEIALCDRVTGEDCFIARVHVRSVADLERVIDRIIPYAMTNTSIIQSSPVPARLPMPESE
jgi:Lrp/AsnC family leucine-responsive transcriptional regulator